MMNFTDLISGSIGSQAADGISQKLGVDKNQTQWVMSAAIPLMMSAINYNAQNKPEKAEGLQQALSSQHSGGIFDNLGALFNNGPTEDDDKIVNHIFGKNTESVKETLAEKSGINIGKIGGILALIAPLVMGYLGKQNKESQSSSGGIGDLLGNILGGGSNQTSTSGGGIGDLIGSVLGGSKSTDATQSAQPNILGGLGDLAGEFFNQKNDSNTKGGILDNLAGMFNK